MLMVTAAEVAHGKTQPAFASRPCRHLLENAPHTYPKTFFVVIAHVHDQTKYDNKLNETAMTIKSLDFLIVSQELTDNDYLDFVCLGWICSRTILNKGLNNSKQRSEQQLFARTEAMI